MIRSAKSIRQSYYREQLRSLRNCDPRRWWKHTKALTGQGKLLSTDLHAMANSLCRIAVGDSATLAGENSNIIIDMTLRGTLESNRNYLRHWKSFLSLSGY